MGFVASKLEEQQKKLARVQKVLEIKQKKIERDMDISTRIASTRDKVNWMSAFYVTMGSASLARMFVLKKFAPLPLCYVPFVMVPFMIGYQIDLAYGSKAERIYQEAKRIREEEEGYWFNEPIELPLSLKDTYREIMDESNALRLKAGLPPEKEWGR